ncbi:DUF2470 domain-containing protein [Prauserella rugosa]|uniref:DUF2470 domain-containing protein n=1 Tax=Prauserella rugosa TaxID=43354 RepID=UPI0004C37CB8|nr:DUF2470 domain-containing protein [Prauserella rugosa]
MTRTRPQTPRPAERAKTIATRGGPAVLMPAVDREPSSGLRTEPVLHHVHAGGRASILLRDDDPLVTATRDRSHAGQGQAAGPDTGCELAITLEITDEAPVALREPVRGLLWLTGWLRPLDRRAARTRAVTIAEQRPDERLLDLDHGLTMLDLVPASFVLADSEGTHSVSTQSFSAATADPFCTQETDWLRHLEHAHPDVVLALSRHLPGQLRGGAIRPLGIDRYGLRLRVEGPAGDHDVRLGFDQPVDCPRKLGLALRSLVGCPFRHSEH